MGVAGGFDAHGGDRVAGHGLPPFADLVGELSTRSQESATRGPPNNVKNYNTATMTLHRPAVGELEITAEVLTLLGDPNLVIITYTAQPHSASEPALDFLANWSTRRWHPGITARCHTATTPL